MPTTIYDLTNQIAQLPTVAFCSVPGSGGYDAIYIIALGNSAPKAQAKI